MALKQTRESVTKRTNIVVKNTLTVGDLLIPLLSILILLLLTVFVYVPRTVEALETRDEIADVKSNQASLQAKLQDMDPFLQDKLQVQQDLKASRDVIPVSLDVADFTYYVDQIAQENRLQFRKVSSGNVDVNKIGIEQTAELGTNVKGVSGPIVYEGEYDDIVNFLDNLQAQSPFIIEASSINLSKNSGEEDSDEDVNLDLWRIELSIIGYYIGTDNNNLPVNVYQQFTPYTRFPEVVAVFARKAAKLDDAEENRLDTTDTNTDTEADTNTDESADSTSETSN
jgi:Tfp pilus assembly protein PilO